jgi:hypothetical protein
MSVARWWSRTARMLPVTVMTAMAVMALWATSARASSIAFLRGGNIWIAAPDGSHATQLTSGGGYTYVSASKAPGTMLLAYRAGTTMGVINADGTGQRQIVAPRGLATAPDVEVDPSGTELAYAAVTGFGAYGGYAAISGSGGGFFSAYQSNVVDVGWADSGTTALWSGFLSGAPGNVHHPDCTASGAGESIGIAVQQTNPDGAAQANPTSGFFCVPGDDVLAPEGSPDGSKVLATLGPRDGQTRIIEVDRSTMSSFSEPPAPFTYETPASVSAGDPDWSPDMTQIAFDGPGGTVWTVSAGGQGTPIEILDGAASPAWSPYTLPSATTTPPGVTPPAPTSSAPNTRIIRTRTDARRHRVTFTFTAIGKATGFQCALVKLTKGHKRPAPRFRSCRSPKSYNRLAHGRYAFAVRATNRSQVDPSPARTTVKM